MKTYKIYATRISTYEVQAKDTEEAMGLFLNGDPRVTWEDDETTDVHTEEVIKKSGML